MRLGDDEKDYYRLGAAGIVGAAVPPGASTVGSDGND